MPTVIEATRAVQRQLGLTTVFGNPGTTEVPFLSDWPDDFRYVLGLQESVVVAMADAYAQLTSRVALVNLHSAGGLGHALGAVAGARRNRAPLVLLVGQQARPLLGGEPFLGAPDAAAFPRPHVRWSHEPASAAEVPAALLRAHRLALAAPRGPVVLSVPVDDWDAVVDEPDLDAEPVAGPAPDPAAVGELGAQLAAAAAPALVAGAEVDAGGAVPALVGLAEALGAPVWAAPLSGRCAFPEDHPLFAGFLDPERGAVATALAGHDLVAVLGAPAFTYHVTRTGPVPPLPALALVDDDPDVLARAPRGRRVHAAAGPAVRALLAAVRDAGAGRSAPGPADGDGPAPSWPAGAARPAARPASRVRATAHRNGPDAARSRPVGGSGADGAPAPGQQRPTGPGADGPGAGALRPRPAPPAPTSPPTAAFVYAALAAALPPGGVVVEEAPSHRGDLHEHLRLQGGDFLANASGILGWGIGAAVGAALARPDDPVVAVLGDGSAMYGIQALWTAAREGVRAVFVVLDNGGYRAVELLGSAAGGAKLPGTVLGGLDFAALAQAQGVPARRVDTAAELPPALGAALRGPGPTLLHVPVDAGGPAPY